MNEGISQENAKKVSKLIRDQGPKGLKARSKATNYVSAARAATTFKRCKH